MEESLIDDSHTTQPPPSAMADQALVAKRIPNTNVLVDGFRFQGPEFATYFLTHAHSDHTTGTILEPSLFSRSRDRERERERRDGGEREREGE